MTDAGVMFVDLKVFLTRFRHSGLLGIESTAYVIVVECGRSDLVSI